jgi:hypothetical protein
MRYVVAMICGLAGAAIAGKYVAVQVAPWISRQFSYTSPDGAADVEQLSFIGVLVAGLALGWTIGWLLARPLGKRPRSS